MSGRSASASDASHEDVRLRPNLTCRYLVRHLIDRSAIPWTTQLPEFWKRRPVVILSFRNTLHGSVTIVPCSTQAQPRNKWAFPLQTTIDGRAAFAICDKITSVAVSRLVPDKPASFALLNLNSTTCYAWCLRGSQYPVQRSDRQLLRRPQGGSAFLLSQILVEYSSAGFYIGSTCGVPLWECPFPARELNGQGRLKRAALGLSAPGGR